MNKIESGKTQHGRGFTVKTQWKGHAVDSQRVELHPFKGVGSVGLPVRKEVTTAELWHYLRTGDNGGKKIYST